MMTRATAGSLREWLVITGELGVEEESYSEDGAREITNTSFTIPESVINFLVKNLRCITVCSLYCVYIESEIKKYLNL